MIDINEERALGEVMDSNYCIEYLNRNTIVTKGSYEQCGEVDIVVIIVGATPKPGETRLDTLELSANASICIVRG